MFDDLGSLFDDKDIPEDDGNDIDELQRDGQKMKEELNKARQMISSGIN